MSRRENRSSDSKRHRSRFDREPSPKRSRRDGKQETERHSTKAELDKNRLDRDHKDRRRLQDPLPLEAPLKQDPKVETGSKSKESENKTNGDQGGTKHSSDPSKVPQSRSSFQHGDRGSAGQNGRSFSRRTENERGWWRDPKEQQNDPKKDEKAKDNREQIEADTKPSTRKRPSFREQKITSDVEKPDKPAADNTAKAAQDRVVESGRRIERGYNREKPERQFSGDKRNEAWRGKSDFPPRDRYNGSRDKYRGGNDGSRFGARQGYNRPTEKWKHDLYDEANKSPNPKNEEDRISKIEALLSS